MGAGSKVKFLRGTADHVNGVDLSFVATEGVHELHVSVVPDLDGLVIRSCNADSGLLLMEEADAADGVGMSVLVNSVFALSSGIPDLDLVVATASKDLSAVSRECDRKNTLGVADHLVNSLGGVGFPKTNGTVPRGGENVVTVSGQADLLNKVRVAGKHLGGPAQFSVFL